MQGADTTPTVTPEGVTRAEERPVGDNLYRQDGWAADMPWLVHGITGNGADMSLFGSTPVGTAIAQWVALRDRLGCVAAVHARQVHGASVHVHGAVMPGLLIADDADGHITTRGGVLLGVTVADCVPIYIAAPDVGAVALLHGGWRGIAAGILENGIGTLVRRCGATAAALRIHFGPAICGDCFEVGPEVPTGLGLTSARDATHVDLRAALAHRAAACGVPAGQISISTYCTRHGDSPFYSHRAGCAERQLAILAVRSATGASPPT
ncbi:MAG: polyphenol oxidase family protein [Gemmatimonadota bacterium]